MRKGSFTSIAALCLLLGSAAPALADVTAQDVWTDWQDLLDSYGATVSTGSQNQSGGTLTINDLSTTFNVEGGTMALNIGDISFTEQGDGTVRISMPDTMPFDMDITDPNGKRVRSVSRSASLARC